MSEQKEFESSILVMKMFLLYSFSGPISTALKKEYTMRIHITQWKDGE